MRILINIIWKYLYMIRKLVDKWLRRPIMEMTFGELIDKRTIFMVKANRGIAMNQHIEQVRKIDDWLVPYMERHYGDNDEYFIRRIFTLMSLLYDCNNAQFDFEDKVLELGGKEGLEAAKQSREHNQRRAALKKEIDELFGEKYLEVKKYSKTKHL